MLQFVLLCSFVDRVTCFLSRQDGCCLKSLDLARRYFYLGLKGIHTVLPMSTLPVNVHGLSSMGEIDSEYIKRISALDVSRLLS